MLLLFIFSDSPLILVFPSPWNNCITPSAKSLIDDASLRRLPDPSARDLLPRQARPCTTKERFRTKLSLLLYLIILSSTPDQGQGTFHRFHIYGWRLEILRAGFVTDAPLPALVANNNC